MLLAWILLQDLSLVSAGGDTSPAGSGPVRHARVQCVRLSYLDAVYCLEDHKKYPKQYLPEDRDF